MGNCDVIVQPRNIFERTIPNKGLEDVKSVGKILSDITQIMLNSRVDCSPGNRPRHFSTLLFKTEPLSRVSFEAETDHGLV